MYKIAIVILNWNGREFLERFLPGVVRHSSSPGMKIIVADNGSSDDSLEFIRNKFKKIEIIELDKNYGFAGGYNKAFERINSEYYILLNSDVAVSENWIEPIIKKMDDDPVVAAAMPKIISYHDRSKFEYAGAAGGFIDKWGYPFCRGRILNNIEPDNNQYNDSIEIFWASGACLFIKSKIFHDAGGFDDDFFAHMEEIDLCWRIKNLGYKIYCYPCSQIYHIGGGTLPNETPSKLFLNFRNSLWVLLKNLPAKKLYQVLLIRKILDGLAAMKFYLTLDWRKGNAVFKAHLSYYKHFRKMKQKRKSADFNKKNLPSSVYKKSILISYFLKKKKTFNELDWQ
ncbi:MAG: glycosyltransferase family 2 protein [Bacteroidales bacterium]|nr:glycosyltransferase family 2 protein [Bacteroidales bacterium]